MDLGPSKKSNFNEIFFNASMIKFAQNSSAREDIEVLEIYPPLLQSIQTIISHCRCLKSLNIQKELSEQDLLLISNLDTLHTLKIILQNRIPTLIWNRFQHIRQLQIRGSYPKYNKQFISTIAENLPNLQSFGIIETFNASDTQSLKKLHFLKEIKFQNVGFDNELMRALVLNLPQLTSFGFRNCRINDKRLQILVQHIPHLTSLDASFVTYRSQANKITSEGIKHLIPAGKSLEKLRLMENNLIGEEGLMTIISNMEDLKQLQISFTTLSAEAIHTLSLNLKSLLRLSLFPTLLNSAIQNMNQLESLEIDHHYGNKTVQIISQNLPNLRQLRLDRYPQQTKLSQLSSSGAFYISRIKGLRRLYLDSESMGQREVMKISKNFYKSTLFFFKLKKSSTKIHRNTRIMGQVRQLLIVC